MRMVMRGLMPAPRGRVRNPVGHRYLEALQASVEGRAGGSEVQPRTSSKEYVDPGLDLLILGITSGTAMDDIDFALCRFTQEDPDAPLHLEIVKYDTVSMPSRVRSEVFSILREDSGTPSLLSQMDVDMGHTFANAVHKFCQKNNIAIDDIDLIGSGGQLVTLTGMPQKGFHRSNMCLGEGAVISAKTGITTVSDYRTAEQAVGRQGAPLFAYLVGLLLHHPTRLQISITIGGITTICFIPPDSKGGIDAMYDWDTGPGTTLIDAGLRFYGIDPTDPSAIPSLSGATVCQPVIDELLTGNPYLLARPPKTTAREIFGDGLALEIIGNCQIHNCTSIDVLATLTRLTSASIVQQMLLFGPSVAAIDNADITIDGRGHYNALIVADLQAEFPGAVFGGFDKTGVPSNAKKAVGFAMQAMEALLGRALPVPSNADVRRPNSIVGKIAPGVRWREVCGQAVRFGGGEKGGRGWEGLPEVRELVVAGSEKWRVEEERRGKMREKEGRRGMGVSLVA